LFFAAAEAESAVVALRYKMLTLEAAGARREKELDAIRDRLGDKVRNVSNLLHHHGIHHGLKLVLSAALTLFR
jgi:hypothetical protein